MADYEPYYRALEQEIGLHSATYGPFYMFSDGDRSVAIQWDEARTAFLVRVRVGTLPAYGRVEVLKKLLTANFLMEESFGGALDCDPLTDEVGVSFQLPARSLAPEMFLARLRAMRDAAGRLGSRLGEESAEQARLALQRIEAVEAAYEADEADTPSVSVRG